MEGNTGNEEITPPRKSINLLKRVPHIYNSTAITPLAQTIRDECNIFCKRTPASIDSPFRIGNHSTPPSRILKVRNPFDVILADKLHLPIYSPSLFAKSAPPNSTEKFEWTIDEISSLNPAPIEEFPSHQFEEPEDPELESTAHANIEKYFSKNLIVPSPWHQAVKPLVLPMDLTPTQSVPKDDQSTSKEVKVKRNCYAQTVLSLPIDLPENVVKVLQPYFTFTKDQQQLNNSENNIDNISLCRKLFHHSPISTDSEAEYSALSPIPVSPCMEISKSNLPRNYGSPLNLINDTSPQISPIMKSPPKVDSENHPSNFHRSTPSPNKKCLAAASSDTLEESPLSPISKNCFEYSKRKQLDESENNFEDGKYSVSLLSMSSEQFNDNLRNQVRSATKLDFTVEMSVDSSMNVVPDINVALPEQSTSSINLLGTSDVQDEHAESFINWDLESESISNRSKIFNFSGIHFDNQVKEFYINSEEENEKVMITSVSNTPTKTKFNSSVTKRLSRVLSEKLPFEMNKENICPQTRNLLRRSFSNIEFNNRMENYRIREQFYAKNFVQHVNKRHCFKTTNAFFNEDDGIRDRSLLHKECNLSICDQTNENTFSSSQDTGYVSNECGENFEL